MIRIHSHSTLCYSVEEGCEGKARYFDIEFNIEDPAKRHMLQVKEALDGNDQISKDIVLLDEQVRPCCLFTSQISLPLFWTPSERPVEC